MARPLFTARPDALARIPLHPAEVPCDGCPLLTEAVTVASASVATVNRPTEASMLTWRAYATRSWSRTTPHSVFAGVAPATFDTKCRLRLGSGHRTRTTPDPAWLSLLARSIIGGPEGLTKARVTTSNLAVRRGDRWECERPVDGGPARPTTIQVRDTEVTSFILRACRDGLSAPRLLAELAKRWPRAGVQTAARLVRELIDGGFLLHDLLPADPRCDPLGHLLDRLPDTATSRSRLQRLRNVLAAADRHPPGRARRMELLTEATAIALDLLPANRVLRVDTAVDAVVVLPLRIAHEAARAAEVLWRVGQGTDPLTDYHQRFLTRYGTGRSVPLGDLLNPVIGLGPLEEEATAVGAGPADPRAEAELDRLLSGALAENATEIVLDEAAVDRLAHRAPGAVPLSAEIYVQVLAAAATNEPEDELRTDGEELQIAVCGGSQIALSSTARFVPLLGSHAPGPVGEAGEETLVAELVVRPRTSALASVAAETGLADLRIAVGVPTRPDDLDLDDLMVFSTGEHLVVWSRVHDRRVLPVLYSRISPQLLPPPARFLAAAGHAGERPWHLWSWRGAAEPFTPAVRYRGIRLTPARWSLPRHLMAAADEPNRWEAALATWRTNVRPTPPDVVITDDADRRLPLDLRRREDRELLRRYVRRGLTSVTALPDGTRQAVLPGPDGHHLLELVVSLDRTDPPPASVAACPPVRGHMEGLYHPGGEWLSLAIEAPATCHEQILNSLARQAGKLPDDVDRWFWLRYRDGRHGEHLRVRFHADPAATEALLPSMAVWASGLHQRRLIRRFCVESYEQEIERYGGSHVISAAERFFTADSILALDVLSNVRDPDQRLIIAAGCTAAISDRVADRATGPVRLDRNGHRRVNILRAGVRRTTYSLPTRWKAALDDYARILSPSAAPTVASDLIHLHCNRLVPGDEDLVRVLAADLAACRARLAEGAR